MHRPTPEEEIEAETALIPDSGDGAEVAKEQPAEGMEPELEDEGEQVSLTTNQSTLSRSQKRRRHRR